MSLPPEVLGEVLVLGLSETPPGVHREIPRHGVADPHDHIPLRVGILQKDTNMFVLAARNIRRRVSPRVCARGQKHDFKLYGPSGKYLCSLTHFTYTIVSSCLWQKCRWKYKFLLPRRNRLALFCSGWLVWTGSTVAVFSGT